MNRHTYRGKKVGRDEWAYGYLTKDREGETAYYKEYPYRIHWHPESGGSANCPVVTDTIGQFTGLYDRNNTPVFENDEIVIHDYEDRGDGSFDPVVAKVLYDSASYVAHGYEDLSYIDGTYDYEVIHDKGAEGEDRSG